MAGPRGAVALAVLLVLAGCSAPLGTGADPFGDPKGWEDGHWYDDPLHVTTEDGLNATEREAVVARTMARVERIRDLEFREPVPVEVVSRERYRNRSRNGGPAAGQGDEARRAWSDQVWEALFLVGEDRRFSEVYGDLLGTSVQGFYSSGRDEIVIVSDSETPTVDRKTLAHELVHALQDQHFSFGPDAATQDQQLANEGLTEGDANLVMNRYERRCASGWRCLPRPERRRSSGGNFPLGVFVTIYQPYAAGPSFVRALENRGGWRAVDAAYGRFPASTEQVIHPETYPDETPVEVTVRNRSRNGWERFDLDPVADTVGEASIYATMQANGQLPEQDTYNYSHPVSTGWAGDSVYPYRNGEAYGYVWRTEWDSETDAREFLAAYRGVLRQHDATRDGDVYVVPESDPFGDAFRVTRSGATVTVVNGPTRAALDDIHPR